jgi:nucleoside-diphosphate kinase
MGYIKVRTLGLTSKEQGAIVSERTLAIIKPDAVKKKIVGKIIQRIEDEGFEIVRMKLVHLKLEEAKGFYIVHKEKGFYASLTEFMSSGPCVPMVLECEGAINRWREVMGATDPALAKPGTLRRAYGFSIERNAVHGSDAPETAEWEIKYFFPA